MGTEAGSEFGQADPKALGSGPDRPARVAFLDPARDNTGGVPGQNGAYPGIDGGPALKSRRKHRDHQHPRNDGSGHRGRKRARTVDGSPFTACAGAIGR